MRRLRAKSVVPGVALLLLAAVGGCALPENAGRWYVADELNHRTGHELGPEKPACECVIPNLVQWRDGLSEEEAVALGLWNNAAFAELLADLNLSWADVVKAGEVPNPQATTLIPVGPKDWEFALQVPLDILWLRPHRVAIAQLESERVAERLVQDGVNVIAEVRTTYTDLLLAEAKLRLAEEGRQLRGRLANTAEARLDAGAVSELEISPLRLDALFAREELTRSKHDVELARQRLSKLLGLEFSDVVITTVPPSDESQRNCDVEQLVADAVATRPDLQALRLAYAAASERAELAHCDYFNLWGIFPDINAQGDEGFEAGPGLQIDIPIFNQNQAAIAKAAAEADKLEHQYVALRDQAALEVRQAHTRLVQARESLEIWRGSVVPEAQRTVDRSQSGLAEDAVSLPTVLDATQQWLAARQREAEAAAEVRRAWAELERSVGHRLHANPMMEIGNEELPAPVRRQPDMDGAEPLP